MNRFFSQRKSRLASLALIAALGLSAWHIAAAATVVIDVRTPEEFQLGHPNGAINIPHADIASKAAGQGISKSDTIKLYSRGGGRAEQAKAALQSAGYSNVEIQP